LDIISGLTNTTVLPRERPQVILIIQFDSVVIPLSENDPILWFASQRFPLFVWPTGGFFLVGVQCWQAIGFML